MVAPLAILSVPTVLAGVLLGLPPEGGAIHGWLEEVFLDAEQSGAGVLPGSFTATGHETFQLIGHDGLLLDRHLDRGGAGDLPGVPLLCP